MNSEIQYSAIPVVQDFLTPPENEEDFSRLQVLTRSLLEVNMSLSRTIMYAEDDQCADSGRTKAVKAAMSVIADIYEVFVDMEEGRREYIKAMESMARK